MSDVDLEPRSGSALADFLFPAPAERDTGSIVTWWESRRVAYNLIVGGTGLLTLAAVRLILWLPPGPAPSLGGVMVPVIVYAIMANLCYLFGPALEILIEKLFGRDVLPTGPALFRIGLTFSVGLTLIPVIFAIMGWVFRIVGLIV